LRFCLHCALPAALGSRSTAGSVTASLPALDFLVAGSVLQYTVFVRLLRYMFATAAAGTTCYLTRLPADTRTKHTTTAAHTCVTAACCLLPPLPRSRFCCHTHVAFQHHLCAPSGFCTGSRYLPAPALHYTAWLHRTTYMPYTILYPLPCVVPPAVINRSCRCCAFLPCVHCLPHTASPTYAVNRFAPPLMPDCLLLRFPRAGFMHLLHFRGPRMLPYAAGT